MYCIVVYICLFVFCCFTFCCLEVFFFCFKQKTAYEMRISDWSSDVCSSDLPQRYVFQLRAEFLADHIAGGEDCDILEHRFAAIAEARRLDGRDLEPTAELVDDERGQRLAFDVLGDNEKRRSEEHTSELQSLMRISYAVFCLKKKTRKQCNNKSSEP